MTEARVLAEVRIDQLETYTQPHGRTWRARFGCVKRIRRAVSSHLLALGYRQTVRVRDELQSPFPAHPPLLITLTRLSPKTCDAHDNLRSALKPVADEVTRWLGLQDDADPRLRWAYSQEKAKTMGVAIRFENGSVEV